MSIKIIFYIFLLLISVPTQNCSLKLLDRMHDGDYFQFLNIMSNFVLSFVPGQPDVDNFTRFRNSSFWIGTYRLTSISRVGKPVIENLGNREKHFKTHKK